MVSAWPYDPEECVFGSLERAVEHRLSLGWVEKEARMCPILPESLTKRGLRGDVGDTISQIAEQNGIEGQRAQVVGKLPASGGANATAAARARTLSASKGELSPPVSPQNTKAKPQGGVLMI